MPYKVLHVPDNIALTQYVSFQDTPRHVDYGVVLGFFNGYTKHELRRMEAFRKSVSPTIGWQEVFDAEKTPHPKVSIEPNALVLQESTERFRTLWIPLSKLTFLTEQQIEDLRSDGWIKD